MVVSFFSLIINISVALLAIFRFQLGVSGLALAIVLAGLAQAIMLMTLLLRRIQEKNIVGFLVWPVLKMIFSSLVSAVVVWLLLRSLDRYVFDTSRIVGLLALTTISVGAGLFCYLTLTLFLGLTQARTVFSLIKRVVSWFKFTAPLVELPPIE